MVQLWWLVSSVSLVIEKFYAPQLKALINCIDSKYYFAFKCYLLVLNKSFRTQGAQTKILLTFLCFCETKFPSWKKLYWAEKQLLTVPNGIGRLNKLTGSEWMISTLHTPACHVQYSVQYISYSQFIQLLININ